MEERSRQHQSGTISVGTTVLVILLEKSGYQLDEVAYRLEVLGHCNKLQYEMLKRAHHKGFGSFEVKGEDKRGTDHHQF